MFYKNGIFTRYYRSFFHEEQSHFCRPLCRHIVIYIFILRSAVSLPSDKELVLYHPFIKPYFSNLISVLGDKFRKISYENIGRRACYTFREYYGWLLIVCFSCSFFCTSNANRCFSSRSLFNCVARLITKSGLLIICSRVGCVAVMPYRINSSTHQVFQYTTVSNQCLTIDRNQLLLICASKYHLRYVMNLPLI